MIEEAAFGNTRLGGDGIEGEVARAVAGDDRFGGVEKLGSCVAGCVVVAMSGFLEQELYRPDGLCQHKRKQPLNGPEMVMVARG